MIRFLSAAVALLTAITLNLTSAYAVENVWDYSVQVSSAVQASPAKITLSWPQDTNGTPSSYTIFRKAPSDTNWGAGTTIAGGNTSYVDTNVTPGTPYEYRITKAGPSSYTGYGYIRTGINVPLVDYRGKVVLVVDNTVSGALATELKRLEQDMIGDGWSVVRHDVSRTATVASVKALIKSAYDADRANVKAVFLFGHIPVPYSGQFNPDGHPDHIGAWPADAFYGDMDGNWTDSTVNYTQTINTDVNDARRISNVPGDGKFDQSDLPSNVELQVGRVDLANMPGRKEWGGAPNFASETELLRKYLNKDHAFRNKKTTSPRRAILGDYFGARGGEAFGASGFRSFAPLVGASNIRDLNREFNDGRGVWIPQVSQNDALLVYGCGAGSYDAMSGIGSTGLYNGGTTYDLVKANTRGVFNLLFGSWLGDWDHEDNFLRAPLATDYGLVSVWSGRPHWYLHPMGQGETIGFVAQLVQNNSNQYQHAINTAARRTHIALMGDPTLRLHPVAPVGSLNGSASGSSVNLSWTAASDSAIVGYHVYRATSANGQYTRLTSSPTTSLNYTDSSAPSGAVYQVRAVKLEETTSGSYYNQSQGAFWSLAGGSSGGTTNPPATVADTTAPTVTVSSPASGATISGASVTVSVNANDNVGVTGVQFKLDGANLGSEDTSAPFSTVLNTTALSNGSHTLGAVARDAAGNMASATTLTVTVANAVASNGGTSGSGGSTTTTTTTTPPPSTVTAGNTTLATAGTVVWIDDALPAGAGGQGSNGDTWNWVTSPTFSGGKAHRSDVAAGKHEHWFGWSNSPLIVNQGEKLFTYVYLDPANPPKQIMLSWSTNSSWEHRAYWGADLLKRGTGAAYYNAGALPEAGKWVRLEVPASAVGLDASIVTAMMFTCYDGGATWDASGKSLPTTSAIEITPTPTQSITPNVNEVAFFDDALPAGAGGVGSYIDTWNWISANPTPYSGTKAHKSNVAAGEHKHWFGWASEKMPVASGDVLYTYVYLDPANPPSEIMIAWSTNSSWEHRAYWGQNKINIGNGVGRYRAGALPPTGQWVRLEVPAAAVGLAGETVTAMNFILFDGGVTWDKTGKFNGSAATTGFTVPASSSSGSTSGGTSSGTNTSTTTTTTTSGGTTSGGTTSGTNTSTTTTTTTSGGTTSGGTSSGSTTTTTPTTTTPSTTTAGLTVDDTLWIDDALPTGAGGMGSTVDTWNWTTNLAFKGTKSHRSDVAAGKHEHWFGWSNNNLPIAVGEKLFTYVYLDPANPPKQIMLSWSTQTSWDQRAYWGADLLKRGTGAAYYNAGPLPATGKWVRLEVPASAVGLEGKAVTAMMFTAYDGGVNWDASGKSKAGSSSSGSTSGGTSSGSTTTTTPTTTTPVVTTVDTLWIDDALPTGAGGMGSSVDTWNWVTNLAFAGTKSHRSDAAAGKHEHWFGWSNNNLSIATGDKLITYVYLDPANPPKQIMLSWSTQTSWDQRAYWGADLLKRGTGAAYYNAGALPATGKWVRLEVPASAVGLEGKSVTAMMFTAYDGAVNWDASGKASTVTSSGGTTSGGSTSGSTTSSTTTTTTSGGTTSGGTTSGSTTTTTPTTGTPTTGTPVTNSENAFARIPEVGDHELRVLTPTVLELRRIVLKQPDPATFADWNFVDTNGNFSAPATNNFAVTVNGQAVNVSSVGFRRIVAYGQLWVRDMRVEASLYLTLSSPIADGQAVEVKNPSGNLWSTSFKFASSADPLRFNPAIHVNQEGYAPSLSKKAMIGYYLGNQGELTIDSSKGFKLVNAATGVTVHTGTLTHRVEAGYQTSPLPYQKVYEADFTSFKTPGEYQLVVPGMGASLPFLINEGVAMAFTRTYELGLYHQRCGHSNALPFTRFTHDACHVRTAEIPTASGYDFTWRTIANYSGGNSTQTAPQLTNASTMLYPFVRQGTIDVSGGHHDAGDYSKYTTNVAQLAHQLMFTADSIKGASALDNLGIPESGDGVSDIMQEAKWEADYLAKLQDSDGGFYFIVYPKNREYEGDVSPEKGDQQVVWPKNTSATAAAVGVLAQFASSPLFKAKYPDVAAKYLSQAKLGWQFLMNAHAKYGKVGAYQKITFYGDTFNDNDELSFAAAALFAATGEAQYHTKLKEWFPNPADHNTFQHTWQRMWQGYGAAIRMYAFAARSGRLAQSQLDPAYLALCEGQVTAAGDDALTWATQSAYGTSFPSPTRRYMQAGWVFSMDSASDMAVAYQVNPKPAYVDALTTNMNYEAGANPVNASFVAGLGYKRPREMVSQYRNTNRHLAPPIGQPLGNVRNAFSHLTHYGTELSRATFPNDGQSGTSYPLQDRFSDIWNVTAEFITINQARGLTSAAFLATQTTATTPAWKPASTLNITSIGAASVGKPFTLSVNTVGLDLTGARILWEAQDGATDFGTTFNVTPKSTGTKWVEVEISWPDGRRLFGTGSFTVQ